MFALILFACTGGPLDTSDAPAGGGPHRVTFYADPNVPTVLGIETDGPWQALHCGEHETGATLCEDATDVYVLWDGVLCSALYLPAECVIGTLVADEIRIAYW